MYSRYHDRADGGAIRIPAHYSGCAFSDTRTDVLPTRFLEVAKPSPAHSDGQEIKTEASRLARVSKEPSENSPLCNSVDGGDACAHNPTQTSEQEDSPVFALLNPVRQLLASLKGGGQESDRILLIGLILLLSQGEKDSDILLWLVLLLLCG